jgi:crotonobetainyl-CoA:carnitine CoA-transferase CaiB-like acyl-CoA transferase
VMLTMLQPGRYWPEFCQHIGRPELAADPRFSTTESLMAHSAEAAEVVHDAIASRTLAELTEAFAGMEGQWAVAQNAWELSQDPALRQNGFIVEVTDAEGQSRELVASPVQFDETALQLRRAPQFAEHTDEILTMLGKSEDELLALKISGAVT